ncbi:MAG: DUF2283 domain-containing protein [Candidatus Omnitrophota bacterium]
MKVMYDPEVDALQIVFKEGEIESSEEEMDGMIFDFNEEGKVLGLEILNASEKVDNLDGVEFIREKARA